VTRPVVWLREAEAELRHARDWYDAIRPDLGDRFALAVEETVKTLAEQPGDSRWCIAGDAVRECVAFLTESSSKCRSAKFWLSPASVPSVTRSAGKSVSQGCTGEREAWS